MDLIKLPKLKKLLLFASALNNSSRLNEIKMGKFLYLSVTDHFFVKYFPCLNDVKVKVLRRFGKSTENENLIELFVLPHPWRKGWIFTVYEDNTKDELVL